jgi:ATP-dependent DNA helicase RecQ
MSVTEVDPTTLLDRFGLERFRPGQQEVVESVLGGRDVMCVMPTGGGKSLCYQLPSLAMPGTTIVVSPLIALMKDQVDALRQRGIAAALINSSLSAAEQSEAMRQMAAGAYDLVYVAPERLRNRTFLDSVGQAQVSLLAVDEAHCISEWGHDFRPDYARLGMFRERYLGDVQTIALTATATPAVREDIGRLLRLREPRMFITGFARDNLRFEVAPCKGDREKDAWLGDYLTQQPGAGIIYAATRRRCEEIADWLPERTRRPVGVYHAGIDPAQRQQVQEQFMSGRLSVIVATNAFGMGIDKSDLRFVVHYNMPGTLEAYYQEAGRAGRDGRSSECVLLFSYSDRHIQEFFIENRYPSANLVRQVYQFLSARTEDPIELTLAEVRDAVDKQASSEAIGTAETLLSKAGVLKRLDSSSNHAVVRLESDMPTLVDLLPKEAKLRRRVMRAVEKVVGDHRHEDVYVRPQRLCELAEVNREQLGRVLRELSGLQAFDYVPPFRGRAVHMLRRDLRFEDLQIDFAELERRKKSEYDKLEAVIGFARSSRCRQQAILDYFGDTESRPCQLCDRCQPVNPRLVGGDRRAAEQSAARAAASDNADVCRGVRIILSGIARTHGRFGKGLVAQMLCGSRNKKMQQWKLTRLSTYGMLAGLKQSQVTDVIDALAAVGLVGQVEVEQRRPTVQLTEEGKEVMMGRQAVPAVLQISYPLQKQLARVAGKLEAADVSTRGEVAAGPEPRESSADGEGDGERSRSAAPETTEDRGDAAERSEELIGRLKRWRRRVAAAAGIPAFRVLTNATLERIAETAPRTIAQLEEIRGVGTSTIEEYGLDLVELVVHSDQAAEPVELERAGASAATDETEPRPPVAARVAAPGQTAERPDSYWSWRLLQDGYTPDQIVRIRRIDMARLLKDLHEQAEAGQVIPPRLLADDSPLRPDEVGLEGDLGPAWHSLVEFARQRRRG